jgi:hypothetical protein
MRLVEIRPDERPVKPGRRKVPPPPPATVAPLLTIPLGKLLVQGIAPTVVEYSKGTVVYVNGAAVSSSLYERQGAFRIHKQTIGRATATIDFIIASGGSFVPAIGNTIRVVDWGRTLFAGVLQTVQTDRQGVAERTGLPSIFYHCTAVDRAGICDHRIVLKSYAIADWNDYSPVILDIVANYLNGEGITTGGVSGSGVYGALVADLNWSFPTVTQAFDQIAKDAGLMWWIDQAGDLTFSSMGNLPAAPFSLTETSGNWRSLKITTDLSTFYNKIYAVGNRNAQPSGAQTGNDETWFLNDSWPNVIPDPNDPLLNDTGIPLGVLTSAPISSITSIVLNLIHPQSVYLTSNYTGQAPIDGFDLVWLYDVGSNKVKWVFRPAAQGSAVEIKYTPVTPSSQPLSNISGSSAQTPLTGTMGSGIYEGVIQVANFDTVADLNAIAAAALTRLGGVPLIADIETDHPGLEPGQLIPVNVPLSGATNKSLLITTVEADYMIADIGQPGFHSNFRYTAQARSNLDPGNWLKWFERQFARTQNQLAVANFEEAIFVIDPATGNSNPWPVSRGGPVFETRFSATSHPTQTVTIQIVQTTTTGPYPPGGLGGRFNLGPPIVIPTNLPDLSIYLSTIPGILLNAHDILSLTVTFSGGGSPGSGLTFKVRWQVS